MNNNIPISIIIVIDLHNKVSCADKKITNAVKPFSPDSVSCRYCL